LLNDPPNRCRQSKLGLVSKFSNRLADNQEIPAASGRVEVL